MSRAGANTGLWLGAETHTGLWARELERVLTGSLYNVLLIVFLNCKSLWIKASAKLINVM